MAREIEAAGGTRTPLAGDVRDADALRRAVRDAWRRSAARCSCLVNNAGVRADGLSPADRRRRLGHRSLDTNLSAAFRTTRRALRPMIRARFGRIVNIASIVGPRANPGQANYAASKAGLIGMTKTVAAEVARRGVTVNAVAPGFIETDMTEGSTATAWRRDPGAARRHARGRRRLRPLPGLRRRPRYVTGTTLTVDGGLTA